MDRAAVYIIYIQEAHASDLWPDDVTRKAGIEIREHTSLGERERAATACVLDLRIEVPALVDGIGNPVEALYTGWPDRLYVIGKDGRVVFKSQAGPYGFHPAEAEAALRSATQ
jgi:hypothetical protein